MRRALAVLALLSATARAETRASYGGVMHAALASAPLAIDPLSPAPGDVELAALVYDTPFRVDSAGRPRPHLALALDNPDGALRARLKLRPDVRFHDGTALKAADVAASLERARRAPGGWVLAPIRAARAVGDDTVELELARPAPDLALLLSAPAASVLPGGGPRPRPVGSGPFVVDKIDHTGAELHAHAACFAGRPYLDRLQLRAFGSRSEEAGSYEIGALEASRHGTAAFDSGGPKRATTTVEGPIAMTLSLLIGRQLPDATAQPLAAALAAGLDRERLRRLVSGPAAALKPGGAAPRAPLESSGRPKIGLLVEETRLDDRAVADRLQAELARLGVDASIELVDAAVYQWRVDNGRYDLTLITSLPPAPDAGLAELAVLATVDPEAARAALARAPAAAAPLPWRVIPLLRRGARLHHAAELRALAVDGAGRVSWADVHVGVRTHPRAP